MPTTPLSIRFDESTLELLKGRAEKAKLTPREYARNVVLEHLASDADEARLQQSVERIDEELAQLRSDLRRAVHTVLLAIAGRNDLTPEAIDQVLRDEFPVGG